MATDKREKDESATGSIGGFKKSSVPENNKEQKKDDKTLVGHSTPPYEHSNSTGKDATSGTKITKKGETYSSEVIPCPSGEKGSKDYLEGIAKMRAAGLNIEKAEATCRPKTADAKASGSRKAGTVNPDGSLNLPKIDLAGRGQLQGAGKLTTNPVSTSDLGNKVVNYQGQQYFNPSGGLPSAPSGYSWVGKDFSTLVNTATNTALSVPQTLALFNGAAQSSARGPSTGGGTNPGKRPNPFPLSTNLSTPISDTVLGQAKGAVDTQAFYDTIIKSEGTGRFNGQGVNPYDTAGNYSNLKSNNPFPKPISQMTLAEVKYWGSVNKNSGRYSTTAMGAFQIVNGTRDLAQRALGLTDSTIYTPEVQQRMASWIARNQGLSAWQGLVQNPGYMATAKNELGKGGQVTNYQIATGNTTFPYGIGQAGSSATPIGGGSAAGGGGGAGGAGGGTAGGGGGNSGSGATGGGNGSGTLGLQYQRPQQEGQGGYIAQAAAATIAARTGGQNSIAANSLMSNMAGGIGGANLGGLASSLLGGFGGPALSGSVSPNYNVPNWSSGQIGAGMSGVNPMSAVGSLGIPANSATMFPMGNSFSQASSGLGSVPNVLTNSPTAAPLASTNSIDQNLGAAANQAGISQTPQGQFGQFGQSITGSGGGGSGSSAANSSKQKGKADKPTERPKQAKERANRKVRKTVNDKEELDKKLDLEPPLPPKRPSDLSGPLTQAQTRRKTEGDEGPENQSVQKAPGIDENAFTSDFTGALRNLSGAIPGLESMMMRLPQQVLGQFMGNLPAGLQSLLPQGLIPGLSQGPVSLNNLLQLAGGGALGGAAGQLIRSMSGGIPVASMLTQSLQSVPIAQVFGGLGQGLGTSSAALANTLGSITGVVSRGAASGIPVSSEQLNQAISYALVSSGSALPIPIANMAAANPIGSLVNIAMGGLISNGSVPILPTNLSGTNAALLSGLNQKIPRDEAQLVLTIGQITGLLPPNVRNLIPPVGSNAFGGSRNSVQNNRDSSIRQTDSDKQYGGADKMDFQSADKPNLGDLRNINYAMKLSEHYSLHDLTLGVAVCTNCHPLNVLHLPIDDVVYNLMLLARNILEPLRAAIGPFTINSGYRGNDSTTKQNPNWQRSLHGYGRAADLSWGSYARIAQAQSYANAKLHATENLHEGTWLHIAVANGVGGKGGVASRTPSGSIQQGSIASHKGYPDTVGV